MKQPLFEFLLENNPLRGYVKETMEVKLLREKTDVGAIPRALEIGCGTGIGSRLIMKYFSPEKLISIDGNDELIAVACRKRACDAVEYSTQNIRALPFEDDQFDAVFDLADLHNSEDWREGLRELTRVLKPGGLLILEEITLDTFTHAAGKLFRRLAEHPYESMMTVTELSAEILRNGFEVLDFEERIPFGLLKYYFMIARKQTPD